MHVRTWRSAYQHAFPQEVLDDLSDEREVSWRERLERGYVAWVSESEGRIVGFAAAGPSRTEQDAGELYANLPRISGRRPPDRYRLRMRAARIAAFFALSTPTAATGTPGGSWAIESSASSPSSTLFSDRRGTPITGRSV
jgi:hypothetical protein